MTRSPIRISEPSDGVGRTKPRERCSHEAQLRAPSLVSDESAAGQPHYNYRRKSTAPSGHSNDGSLRQRRTHTTNAPRLSVGLRSLTANSSETGRSATGAAKTFDACARAVRQLPPLGKAMPVTNEKGGTSPKRRRS
jgi:hypothetical protein